MNKINVYLVNFTPDNSTFLIEFLENKLDHLRTYYCEVCFDIEKNQQNGTHITKVKELVDILPYLESVYKNKRIKESKVDDKTANYVLDQLYNALKSNQVTVEKDIDKTDNVKVYDNIQTINDKSIVINKESQKTINKIEKLIVNRQEEVSDYLINKKNIKNYLVSRKGQK